jgi:hypothetical protein
LEQASRRKFHGDFRCSTQPGRERAASRGDPERTDNRKARCFPIVTTAATRGQKTGIHQDRLLPRRATAQVGQVVQAQARGDLSQPVAGGREKSPQEPASAQLLQPRLPARRAAANAVKNAG